jgi:hypothetical protein
MTKLKPNDVANLKDRSRQTQAWCKATVHDERRIVAFDLGNMVAILDDGQDIPITNMIDEDREETTDTDEAFSLVAGPCAAGMWYAFFRDQFVAADAH